MPKFGIGFSLITSAVRAAGAFIAPPITYVTDKLKLYFNFAKESESDEDILGDNASYTGHKEVQFSSAGSIEFDGVNGSYFDTGTGVGDALGNNYAGDFSISMWFKPEYDIAVGGRGLFNIAPLGNDQKPISLFITDSDIYFDVRDTGGSDYYRLIHDCPARGKWTHLVCVYKAGVGLEMYINGSVVTASGTASGSGPTISSMDFAGKNTYIGTYYNTGSTWLGKLANVGCWSRALSAEEALSVMHKKYADLGVTEKLSLEGWWGLDESQHSTGETLFFDGTGDYVSIDYHDDWKFAGGFTWAIWFSVDAADGGVSRGNLLGVSGGQSASYGQPYGLTLETSDLASIWFYVGTGGGTNLNDSLSYKDGDYHLVVATMDDNPNGTIRLYFDGTLEKTSTVTHTVGSATGSGQTIAHHGGDLWFGSAGANPGGQDFGGQIPQVAIWSEDLSQSDITSLQNLGVGGDMKSISSSSCIGNWKMDNATTCQDLTSNNRDATVNGPTLEPYIGAKDSSTNARHGASKNHAPITKSVYGNHAPKLPRSIDVATETFGDAIGLGSYSFDGSADWINCGGTGTGNNFLHNITSFTIGAWFRVDGGNDGAIFSNYNSGTGDGILFAYGYSGTGNFDCRIWGGTVDVTLQQTSSTAADGKWHYGAVTLGSSQAKLYLDGVLVDTETAGNTNILTTEPNTFGVRHPNGSPDTKHEGRMAQMGIWTRTLTAAEINSVMEKTYSELTDAEKVDLKTYLPLDAAMTKGLDFNGSSNHLVLSPSSNFNMGTGEFALSFWFTMDGEVNDETLWSMGVTEATNSLMYYKKDNNDLRLVVEPDNTEHVFSNANLTKGGLYHTVVTKEGSDLKHYVNGTLTDTISSFSQNVGSTTQTPYIGSLKETGYTGYNWDGKIFKTAIWKGGSLSSANVTSLYNLGVEGDMSTINNDDLVGYWDMTNESAAIKTLDFDGTNDYINVSSDVILTNPSNWSVSAWVYPHAMSGYAAVALFDFGGSLQVNGIITSGSYFKSIYDDGSGVLASNSITANQWYHIVVTSANNSTFKLYQNGTDVGSGSSDSGWGVSDNVIGRGWAAHYFNGLISQVALFDTTLSGSDVTTLYNGGKYGNVNTLLSTPSSLKGYWILDNATTVSDLSSNSNNGTVYGCTLVPESIPDSSDNSNSATISGATHADAITFDSTSNNNDGTIN